MDNITLWNSIRAHYPTFANHTSEGTAETFTNKGFEAMRRTDLKAINEFFQLTCRLWLLDVTAGTVKDTLDDAGFGESYDIPFGDIVQRMTIHDFKPITPLYNGLKDGDSPDQYKVRKPKVDEVFFQMNFSYQNVITIPDDFQMKTAFISESGMSQLVSGIMLELQNGYLEQKYTNKLQCINMGVLNSTKFPLKETQKMTVTFAGATPTVEELSDFILAIANAKSAMELGPRTDAFNAFGFRTHQDADRLRVLIRPGYKNRIENINALNRPGLSLPVEMIEVQNFGLDYYKDSTLKTKLLPHYDANGAVDGWTETKGGELYEGTVYEKDPNENVLAILADRGLVFNGEQNPYIVEPARNPAGRYTNQWASSPNNLIAADPRKNCIVFYKA